MQYFCPKCGKVIPIDEIEFYKTHFCCKGCHSTVLGETEKQQYILYMCSGCLAYIFDRNPKNSQWKKSPSMEIDEAVHQILERELISPLNNQTGLIYTISFPPIQEFPSKLTITLISSGIPSNSTELSLLLKTGLCNTCNKLLSKRFDAVIQLRTLKMRALKGKDLLSPLMDEIVEYAENIYQNHPDQFISDVEPLPHGFDLKLSNKSMMTSIQSFLIARYSFIVKSSKKLMGKNPNTGGELYRTYLLLRYIPFKVNSVIRIKNSSYVIRKIVSNRILLEDLDTHSLKTHHFDYFEKQPLELLEI